MINKLIAYLGAAYIRGLRVCIDTLKHSQIHISFNYSIDLSKEKLYN